MNMKKICVPAAILLICTGCGRPEPLVFEPTENHTNPPKTTETEPTAVTETAPAEPETELDRRIAAMCTLEPVPIPAGGWTDETLLPVVNIGGAPAELPFCLSNLLYGYAFTGDEANYLDAYADEIYAHRLDFVWDQCIVWDPFSELELPEFDPDYRPPLADPNQPYSDKHMVLDVQWLAVTADGTQRYPISVNCVTIGSTYEELVERIGLNEDDKPYEPSAEDEENDVPVRFTVHCRSESLSIAFTGSEGIVDTILLHDRREKG